MLQTSFIFLIQNQFNIPEILIHDFPSYEYCVLSKFLVQYAFYQRAQIRHNKLDGQWSPTSALIPTKIQIDTFVTCVPKFAYFRLNTFFTNAQTASVAII